MSKLVFLGGTVGNNLWRDKFVDELVKRGVNPNIFFNPVVKDWDDDARKREERAKQNATHMMFYLGSPQQEGNPLSAYSMVEATMSLYDSALFFPGKPSMKKVVVFDTTGIEGHSLKAMKQTEAVLRNRFPKANIFSSLGIAIDSLAITLR